VLLKSFFTAEARSFRRETRRIDRDDRINRDKYKIQKYFLILVYPAIPVNFFSAHLCVFSPRLGGKNLPYLLATHIYHTIFN
jgi:hypothetical protein